MSPKHKAAKPQRMSKMMAMAGVLALLVAFVGIITTSSASASDVVSSSQCPDGTDPGDVNGDGVMDEADCIIVPDHPTGDVSVVAHCGSVVVTNKDDGVMLFEYGSFGSLDGPDKIDGKVKVRSGASVTIKTTRRSIDWMASWEFGGLTTRGIDLKVAQNCGPKPTPVNQAEHPIVAPHAGGAEGGSGLATSLKLAGFSLICGALLFGARRRRTGEA